MRRFLGLLISAVVISILLTSLAAASSSTSVSDPNLVRAVRDAIGKPLGLLPEQDVANLATLHADCRGIASLQGIEKMTGLRELTLIGNDLDRIDPLLYLPNLRLVDLRFNTRLSTSPGSAAKKVIDALSERGCVVYYGRAAIRVEYISLGGESAQVCQYDGGQTEVVRLILASVTDRSQDYHLMTTAKAIIVQIIEQKKPGVPIEGVFCLKESTLPSRWRWEAVDRSLLWTAGSGSKGIVLIVHGWSSGHRNFTSVAEELAEANWTVYAIDYPSGQRIEDIGAALADLVDGCVPSGQKISILAHSMGGLVARSAIEQYGIDGRVDKLITLGTPHNGIPVEYFLNGHNLYLQIPPDIKLDADNSSVRVLASNRTWFYVAARAAYTWRTGKDKPFGLDILDMAKLTSFLDDLNASSSVKTVYYQIAGTEHPPLFPPPSDDASLTKQLADLSDEVFGALSHWAYELQLPREKPTDGVVPLASATCDLSGEQAEGEYIDWDKERVFTFPVNHRAFHLSQDTMQRVKQMLHSSTLAGTVMDAERRGIGSVEIYLSGWFLDSSASDGVVYGVTVRTQPDGTFSRGGYLGPTMPALENQVGI